MGSVKLLHLVLCVKNFILCLLIIFPLYLDLLLPLKTHRVERIYTQEVEYFISKNQATLLLLFVATALSAVSTVGDGVIDL